MCVWLCSGQDEMLKDTMRHPTKMLNFVTNLRDGQEVVVDSISECHLKTLWRLIKDASQNNDGFGADEFESEQDFRNDIKGGSGFALLDKQSGELIAGFILAISKFYRGQNVVDPFLIVRPCERRRGIGELCFQLCVQYAQRLGYMGMYVDTFTTNIPMIRIIERSEGFQKVGYLPMGGRTKTGAIVSSYIYYRDLRDN